MRDQYAGDVSDVIKFAFLRALTGNDRKLGIAWYYAPSNDGGPEGRHIEWREDEAWRLLDEQLHAGLASLPERSIAALEQAPIWPSGALFHREPMPARIERGDWAARKRNALDGADVVFLDPDTGVGGETEKHATYTEIRLLRRPGMDEVGASNIVTLRTNVSVQTKPGSRSFVQRQRWFTVVDTTPQLTARSQAFATALCSGRRVTARLDGTM
jgi:hypothetical protein